MHVYYIHINVVYKGLCCLVYVHNKSNYGMVRYC